jgi:hypothetical protein
VDLLEEEVEPRDRLGLPSTAPLHHFLQEDLA